MLKYSKQKSETTLRRVVLVLACLLVISCVACAAPPVTESVDPATSSLAEPTLSTSDSPSGTSSCTSVVNGESDKPSDGEPSVESTTSGTSTSDTTTRSPASRTITKAAPSRVTEEKATSRVTTVTTSTRRSTTPPPTTVSDKITVTFIVECRNAVLRKKEFSGLEDKIDYMIEKNLCSADGHMLKKTVTCPRDTTVYDALLSLPLNVTASAFSPGYISAINGLAEKEGGSYSGWVYLVNGVFVMKGAGQCILNDGDVVHWGYTIERGDVK